LHCVDVTATRTIAAPPDKVAAVMFDPARDPEWIGGAKSVEQATSNPHSPRRFHGEEILVDHRGRGP